MTVEMVDSRLDEIAERVRVEYAASRDSLSDAVEHYFQCGAALLEARKLLPSDQAFGAWRAAQDFGFSRQWAHILQRGAEYEGAVRKVVTTQVVTGNVNFKKAVTQAAAALGGTRALRPPQPTVADATGADPEVFPTIVIDPPWQYDNRGTRGAAADHYPTMTITELKDLTIPAAPDAHLYLWATNNFLREAFELCESWGFTYKTLLTWVKPQMGMGNYFRSVTEHVVFGVRGSLSTARRDRTNVINADRTQHSAKPDAFYDLVEEMSPGPYLDMFSRERRRMGWAVWGNES